MNSCQGLKCHRYVGRISNMGSVFPHDFPDLTLELTDGDTFGQLHVVLRKVRQGPDRVVNELQIRDMFEKAALDRGKGNELLEDKIGGLVPVLDDSGDGKV